MDFSNSSVVLPQENIEEILARSPVRSLLRFKCVSKPFNSLISAPSFARLHLNRPISKFNILTSTRRGIAFLEYETSFRYKFRLDYPPTRRHVLRNILGSCNGLVAVANYLESKKKEFFVWNPSMGVYKKLPDHPKSDELIRLNGFGYDSSTDDYKVFICFNSRNVSIFSLRENSWRMTQPLPRYGFEFYPRFGSFLNEALHWVSWGLKTVQILVFDLKTKNFSNLPVPNKVNGQYNNMGILNGRLCLTFYNDYCRRPGRPRSSGPVELWMMMEYGVKESWTKLLIIVNKYRLNHLPLCSSKGNQVISINEEKELIRSDAQKELEKFEICDCTYQDYKFFPEHECQCQAILYRESLISPNYVNNIEDEQQNQGS